MNVLDLFSGIGGFSLGLERAGMRTVAFCERDNYCRAVLRKHWPRIPCFKDIHSLDSDGLAGLGRIDLVCGGFPCQPFSHAGKQLAQADDRHLWPQMCRIIALARPAWVLGENVAGIIALALDDVLSDLESLGYAARPFVIPAVAVDAKHRRDRVWIIARDANRKSESTSTLNAGEMAELRGSLADAAAMQRRAIERNEPDGTLSRDGVASHAQRDELWNESGRSCRTGWQGSAEFGNDGSQRSLAVASSAGLEERETEPGIAAEADRGFPRLHIADANNALGVIADSNSKQTGRITEPRQERCEWSPEPSVGRVAHGISRRVDRLRTLGNAVVPQVVEEIGRAIMIAHDSTAGLA